MRYKRDFGRLWAGQSVALVGDQVAIFALPTVAVLVLHADEAQVGLLNAVSSAAYPLLGLLIGAWMDRVRRKPAMVTADLVRCAAFATLPIAAGAEVLTLAHLFVVAAVVGVGAVVFDVAYQSYLPTLLQGQELARGNARLEMSAGVSRLAGPSLGGALFQAMAAVGALTASALSFLIAAVAVWSVRTHEDRRPRSGRHPGTLHQIREGAAVLWRDCLLRTLTISAALRNLGMGAVRTVLPLFFYRGLEVSAGVAGAAFTVGALAAIAGAVVSRRLTSRCGPGPVLLLTGLEGVVWLAVPLALLMPSVPTVMVVMALSSLWLPIWNSTVITLRQIVTEPHLLGRVHATAKTINLSTMPLGALGGGVLAQGFSDQWGDEYGLAAALVVSAAVASLSLLNLAWSGVHRLRDFPSAPPSTTSEESRK